MLSNAYFIAKFRFDTAENEPVKNLLRFANFPTFASRASAKTTHLEHLLLRRVRGPAGDLLDLPEACAR